MTKPTDKQLMKCLFCLKQNRRWSSAQAREFGYLHNTVALLVLHSDVSSQRNVGKNYDFCLLVALHFSSFDWE